MKREEEEQRESAVYLRDSRVIRKKIPRVETKGVLRDFQTQQTEWDVSQPLQNLAFWLDVALGNQRQGVCHVCAYRTDIIPARPVHWT